MPLFTWPSGHPAVPVKQQLMQRFQKARIAREMAENVVISLVAASHHCTPATRLNAPDTTFFVQLETQVKVVAGV